ncbi:E3 ubiquitin-protein ligase RNF169 [Alosa sapidissima]|uniref:E3 ubiquitin-protein ligase RNF169 n=1 Tax=Alosa sapidissima TaxID=34773 RepID=UPI001C097BF4|nr:E3 ubiquitin-protein ligase RNF169 [Alosa sapidissima]
MQPVSFALDALVGRGLFSKLEAAREIPLKMAAMGSAKSASGLGQRGRTRPATVPCIRTPARVLTIEEVRCPVCLDILLEPVTMPCRHSVCLHCFERTVEFSLCCPRCRLRVSSWARKQSREKSLVNTELWDMVRKSYPDNCKRRLEQRAGEAVGEEIFRSLAQICKTGDLRQDHDKQKLKVGTNEDKEDKRRKAALHRKEESNAPKPFQDPLCGVLSDSENEEPIGRRTRHVSAFVRKTRTSPAFSRSLPTSLVKRSRSCTDTDEHRGKMRGLPHIPVPDKVSIVHSFNAGILLSSENSRSLSAPVLLPERRHHWRNALASSTPFPAPPSKPERSISPESNDSISEELNHFKPIVCSPCTPPKRLPDGRVMEPTIVKSTPRNLSRSLQKNTSYEASPSILQKWRQVEVDRQNHIKVTSKGTITSPIAKELIAKERPRKDRADGKPCSCDPLKDRALESLCTCGKQPESVGAAREKSVVSNKRKLIFDECAGEAGLSGTESLSIGSYSATLSRLKPSGAEHGRVNQPEGCTSGQLPDIQGLSGPDTPGDVEEKKSVLDGHAGSGRCSPKGLDTPDLQKESNVRNCAQNRPTSRRGKKRSQKTKHLEGDEGQVKRTRTEEPVDESEACGREVDLYVQRLHQEREDRELALRLQRQFDKERQKMDRQKTSPDKYPLRSWASADSQLENKPRRSGRISKKKEHFNYNC